MFSKNKNFSKLIFKNLIILDFFKKNLLFLIFKKKNNKSKLTNQIFKNLAIISNKNNYFNTNTFAMFKNPVILVF